MQGGTNVEGTFERLDCLGRHARIVIKTAEGKTVQLLVRDPAQIVIVGSGEKAFGCGLQKPQRKVVVQYNPGADAKLKTIGEAVSIEFR